MTLESTQCQVLRRVRFVLWAKKAVQRKLLLRQTAEVTVKSDFTETKDMRVNLVLQVCINFLVHVYTTMINL